MNIEVIDVTGAAAILGIHPESLRRLTREGKIHPLRGLNLRCRLFDKKYIESLPKPKQGTPGWNTWKKVLK